jgi:hypothetical protein
LRFSYLDLVLVHYPKSWGESDGAKRNRKDRSDAYGVLERFKSEFFLFYRLTRQQFQAKAKSVLLAFRISKASTSIN